MGQVAFSKPAVQWWLGFNSSKLWRVSKTFAEQHFELDGGWGALTGVGLAGWGAMCDLGHVGIE